MRIQPCAYFCSYLNFKIFARAALKNLNSQNWEFYLKNLASSWFSTFLGGDFKEFSSVFWYSYLKMFDYSAFNMEFDK